MTRLSLQQQPQAEVSPQGVPGARARVSPPTKAPLAKEQPFAGPRRKLARAPAKSSLRTWLLRGSRRQGNPFANAPSGHCKNKNKPVLPPQCAAAHRTLPNLNYNKIIHGGCGKGHPQMRGIMFRPTSCTAAQARRTLLTERPGKRTLHMNTCL